MKKLVFITLLFFEFIVNAQNYNPIINYEFNGTPTKGIKIKTNIPFANGHQMPTLMIEGYEYGGAKSIGLLLSWYIYKNEFFRSTLSSYGGYTPEIKLYNENGKVAIFINDKKYYNRFSIRGYSGGLKLTDAHFQNWSISDESPTGTNEVVVPYTNKFAGDVEFANGIWDKNGNVGIGTLVPSNIQRWNKVLDVAGTSNAKILATGKNAEYKTGIFAHSSWHGGGGFMGTESNHDLHLLTGYSPKVSILTNGNMGIGVRKPLRKLEIYDDAPVLRLRNKKDGVASYAFLEFNDVNSRMGYVGFGSTSTNHMYMVNDTGGNIVVHKGNLGVGTTDTKGFKLGVNGKIAATEVKVATYANWADFVFADDYALPTLKEVEKHIEEKGHLENIPSAKEVKKDGFFLGEMDAKLLQKIEELTLYTIQQEKDLKKQEERIKSQEEKLQKTNSNNIKLLSIIEKLEKRITKLESK